MLSTLVNIENAKKYYPVGRGFFTRSKKMIHAVDGVTLDIEKGRTLGLVGESGCGKSTLGMLCLRLLEPTAGSIRFKGEDISQLSKNQMKEFRRKAQIIFQDPYSSLNPRKNLRQILEVPFHLHDSFTQDEIDRQIREILEVVGLVPADLYINRYPHDLSGGQRQRIDIARAIATKPEFVVADEPVAALDVSVRAQILNLMKRLQEEMELTFLYITHDLAVMRSVSHNVAIMYLGQIVELAEVNEICDNPLHPYTKALLSAVPLPDPRRTRTRKRIILKGEVPSPIDIPQNCRFYSRCFNATSQCAKRKPELVEVTEGHSVRCLAV